MIDIHRAGPTFFWGRAVSNAKKKLALFAGSTIAIILCGLIVWALLLPAFVTANSGPRPFNSQLTNPRSLQSACMAYAQSHNQHFPPSLAALYEAGHVKPAWLVSPRSETSIPSGFQQWPNERQQNWIRGHASYVLVPGLTNDLNAKTIAIFEKPLPSYKAKVIAVAYNDNHVKNMDTAEVDKILKAQTGKTIHQLLAESENARPKN